MAGVKANDLNDFSHDEPNKQLPKVTSNITLTTAQFKGPLGQSGEGIQGALNEGKNVVVAKEVGLGQALAFPEGGGKISDTCINYNEGPILIQDPEVETNDPHDGGYELSMDMYIVPLKNLVRGGKWKKKARGAENGVPMETTNMILGTKCKTHEVEMNTTSGSKKGRIDVLENMTKVSTMVGSAELAHHEQ
ncbi:hypothetical protein ACE6H2_020953 [Prunus campanulata]